MDKSSERVVAISFIWMCRHGSSERVTRNPYKAWPGGNLRTSGRPLARGARTLLLEVHDRRLSLSRMRRPISVYLPRVASGLPPIRCHPFSDRVVRLLHAVVRAAVDRDGSSAPLRFGRVHLASKFNCARDLDTEVAQYRRARLCRVVVGKMLCPISPQAWLTSNELPDLAQPPRRANRVRCDLALHRDQLTRLNGLQVDETAIPRSLTKIVIACPVISGIEAKRDRSGARYRSCHCFLHSAALAGLPHVS
jgi:hypothetical protein